MAWAPTKIYYLGSAGRPRRPWQHHYCQQLSLWTQLPGPSVDTFLFMYHPYSHVGVLSLCFRLSWRKYYEIYKQLQFFPTAEPSGTRSLISPAGRVVLQPDELGCGVFTSLRQLRGNATHRVIQKDSFCGYDVEMFARILENPPFLSTLSAPPV